MVTITAVMVFLAGLLSTALSRQLTDEFKAWLPWIVRRLIDCAVDRLPEDQRKRYEEEWHSHINEIPGEIGKLLDAARILWAAPKMASILRKPSRRGAKIGHALDPTYWLYSAALALGMLAGLPYLLFQFARHGKYRKGLAERLGRVPARLELPREKDSAIWIHAVSVGEVLAVAGLVEEVRRRFPRHRIFVSTTTDTGQALARRRFGDGNVFYFPIDFAFAIRPYLRALRPEIVVICGAEFWPNFMWQAHASAARIAVVNVHISDRSWSSYRRFRGLLRRLLANVDVSLAQTPEDAARLRDIGASPERVRVSGNLKFDIPAPVPPAIVGNMREAITASGARPVLVCGSTVDGEEALLLTAFKNLLMQHPQAVMILAPRHPERFADAAALLERMSISFFMRSKWNGEALSGRVFLLDSIGELGPLYAIADIAFVGGSLVPRGGHNIIEPAQHGVATLVGNHTENFRDIVSLFQSQDAVRSVGPAELPIMLQELLSNDAERGALGRRAAEIMRSQIGATGRTAGELEELLARVP